MSQEFIKAIYGEVSPTDKAQPLFCGFPDDPGLMKYWTANTMKSGKLPSVINASNNCYFSLATFKLDPEGKYKAQKALVVASYAILLDDIQTKSRDDVKLPLSWKIETSPGNYQGGLILNPPCEDRELYEQVVSALGDAGWSDPGAKGAARWSRLPCGKNTKAKYLVNGAAPTVTLTEFHPERRYSIEQVIDAFALQLDPVGKKKKSNTGSKDPVLAALKSRSLWKSELEAGKHDITCPWVDEHTDGVDHGTAYYEPNTSNLNAGGFNCQHGHCISRDIADLKEYLGIASHKSEPIPLTRKIPRPEEYPIDAFPSAIRNAALRMIEVIQAPPALIGQSLLAAVTLAVQPHVDVMIDGRVSPSSNNFLTIGESGIRKSGIDRNANHVIRERQKTAHSKAATEKIDLEAKQAAWKATRTRIVGDKNLSHEQIKIELIALGEEPTEPCIVEYTEEPTYEGLVRNYAAGNLSMGLFSDEGGRFLGGFAMNQENATKTITGLSKLWDGDCITRTRGGDGNILIYGVRLSLHLMLQPILADKVFSDPMLSGQGFMSRCLCCHPESNIGNRPYKEVDLSKDPAMNSYHEVLKGIADIPYPLGEAGTGLNPKRLVFASDAKETWIQFHDHIEALQKDGVELSRIRGFASKAAEHAARIAAVLTYFSSFSDFSSGVISEINSESLDAAIELTQFYISEALRLFDTAQTSPDLILADRALQWATNNSLHPGLMPLANLYQSGPNAIRTSAVAKRIIKILEEHGQVERMNGGCKIGDTFRRDVWWVRS